MCRQSWKSTHYFSRGNVKKKKEKSVKKQKEVKMTVSNLACILKNEPQPTHTYPSTKPPCFAQDYMCPWQPGCSLVELSWGDTLEKTLFYGLLLIFTFLSVPLVVLYIFTKSHQSFCLIYPFQFWLNFISSLKTINRSGMLA